MVIREHQSLLHWSYFLALEADVENLSRYIEFTTGNFGAYSIEMSHILLAASSEVDVVAKQLCKQYVPEGKESNMDQYRNTLRKASHELENSVVTLPRYGLTLTPWSNWQEDKNPNWWGSYNDVKHKRDRFFSEANLNNVLNAMAGLFLIVLHYYRGVIEGKRIEPPPSIYTPPEELASVCPSIGGRMALFYKERK